MNKKYFNRFAVFFFLISIVKNTLEFYIDKNSKM